MRRRGFVRTAAISLAALSLSCGDHAPSAPTVPSQPSAVTLSNATRAQNAAPSLVVRTTPEADYSTNPPTISGLPPLNVFFGLCQSDDSDQGDSLNWQYNFGDSGRQPFNPDGSFNPDTDHNCRTEHTYAEGIYTAWVSVTDKHLEDQSKGVWSLARRSQAFTIKAQFPPSPGAPPPPSASPSPIGNPPSATWTSISISCGPLTTSVTMRVTDPDNDASTWNVTLTGGTLTSAPSGGPVASGGTVTIVFTGTPALNTLRLDLVDSNGRASTPITRYGPSGTCGGQTLHILG